MTRCSTVLAAALLAGCLADENPSSIVITGANVPTGTVRPVCDPLTGTVALTAGAVDVLPTQYAVETNNINPYWVHLKLQSKIRGTLLSENNAITLSKVEIDLRYGLEEIDDGFDPAVAEILEREGVAAFQVPVALTIEAGLEESIGYIGVLPYGVMRAIADAWGSKFDAHPEQHLIIATLRVVGDRGTQRVTSSTFDFPIYVCKGCMTTGVLEDNELFCTPENRSSTVLPLGDPCSGLPYNSPTACCWSDDRAQLICPCANCPLTQ